MLEISNLSLDYGDREILRNINLKFKDSSFNVILGINGAGKTTLFKTILGIIKPKSGKILVDNNDLLKLSVKNKAKLISYVPQLWDSPFDYKVLDIISMGFSANIGFMQNITKRHINIIYETLDLLNIKNLANYSINTLSGGQKALVMLSRALVQNTPIMLLDEPMAHLDIKNQQILLQNIKKLKNKTILINIHDPSIGLDYASNIIAIKNKEILFSKKKDLVNKDDLEKLYGINLTFHKIDNLYFVKAKN